MSLGIIVPYFSYTDNPIRHRNLDRVVQQIKHYPYLVCCFSDYVPNCNTLVFDKGAMVWQKERLINLGFEEMSRTCDAVMYMDADCIFDEPNWYDQITKALEKYSVVQCFNSFRYNFDDRAYYTQGAIAKHNIYGNYHGSAAGGAWAFRTPAPKHYEFCLVGGGDTIFCDWLLGRFSPYFLSTSHLEHYNRWWDSQTPSTNIGYVDLHAEFLPCGTYTARQYAQRHQILKGFSPLDDTFIEEGELIQMPNKALELKIMDYIIGRDR